MLTNAQMRALLVKARDELAELGWPGDHEHGLVREIDKALAGPPPPRKAPRQNLARNRTMYLERRAGRTYADIAIDNGLTISRVRQLIMREWDDDGEPASKYLPVRTPGCYLGARKARKPRV